MCYKKDKNKNTPAEMCVQVASRISSTDQAGSAELHFSCWILSPSGCEGLWTGGDICDVELCVIDKELL